MVRIAPSFNVQMMIPDGSYTMLKVGDVVNVSGESGDWAAVDMNGKLGFVHKSLLSP